MTNVLVVADEKNIRISISEFLKDAGYAVEVAEDADRAIEILSARDFDVVLTDIILPRITGVSLLNSIKSVSPQVEVILMTGEPTVETASEAVRAGAFDYLSKPVTKTRLLAVITNAIRVKMLTDKARLLTEGNKRYRENLEQLVSARTVELQKSEDRWLFALEGHRDGVWDWNIQNNAVFYSKRWKEMLGFKEDEISGHIDEWTKLIHPADKEAAGAALDRFLKGEMSSHSIEFRMLCKDGRYKWILCRGKVMAWSDDYKPLRIIGTHMDITERKQSEEKIKMLSQAIEQSPVSVIITDIGGRIEYVNRAFEQHTGYLPEEVIGQNPRLLKSGKTPEHRFQEVWKIITCGKPWEGEFQNKKKNGELFWEYAHIAPVVDEDGMTRHYLSVQEDITLRKKQEAQLLRQAHFDALTALPNRFLSLDRLTQLLKDAKRSETLLAVLFLDLDDFKKINDTLGHDVGDQLLIESAKRLSLVTRIGDTVGRLGGDEFIVLLAGLHDGGDARPVLKNLLEQFRKPFKISGRELILTTSVGVAIFPEDGETTSELLRCADSAMYHAKKLGRNTFAYFTQAMNREVSRRLALEEQMHGALERGEFSVVYQPILRVSNGRKVGAEALLRWHNPVLGNIFPDEFIPIAEQTGLIVPIGQFVLTTALGVIGQLPQDRAPRCRMAVNLSPRQFRDPQLLDFIEKALQRSGVSARNLELEITEGVLMSGHADINDTLGALSQMGVSISMDDFGTGYSSLSYLRTYPFDVLKIDKSFVNDITVDSGARTLIDASIAMAQGLNLEVVAEGVETEEQLDYLKEQGCDYAQGYFFAKPMSADKLFEWVLKQDEAG